LRLLSGAVLPVHLVGELAAEEVLRKAAEALGLPPERVRLVGARGEPACDEDVLPGRQDLTVCIGPDPLDAKLEAWALEEHNEHLDQLKRFDLTGRGLSRLPPKLFELAGLTGLDLTGNKLAALPDGFGALAALRRLDLQRNRLLTLPDSLGQLAALEVLDVVDNRLASLPETCSQLVSLRVLRLRYNPLKRFPEVLCGLPALLDLNVGHADLSALPEGIGSMIGLQVLDVAGNCLTELPGSFCELASLERFDMQDNPMALEMQDRHPARLVMAFLHRYHRLHTVLLSTLALQGGNLPACIARLVPDLDSFLERDCSAAPADIGKLAAARRAALGVQE